MLFRGRVRRGSWAALCACIVAGSLQASAGATATAQAAAGEAQAEPTSDHATSTSAILRVANRQVSAMRVEVVGASPAERADAAADRIQEIVRRGGPLEVTTRPSADGVFVLVDGKVAFRVLNGDVDAEAGETVGTSGAQAADNLREALAEIRESEDARGLVKAAGHALLATVVFAVLCWILFRAYHWLARHLKDFVHRRMTRMLPKWTNEVVGEAALAGLFTLPLKIFATLAAVLLSYEWTAYVLQRFPYTRPLGESLSENLIAGLGRFGESMLATVPDLLFVALIIMLARIAVRTVRAFFSGVERGHIRVSALDETTARPTGKLVTTGIWLLAMVAAYPYIPGSGSEAFKGIGVFVGLMMSIGASGVVGQVVSGLMLMYTRAIRPGEFVQIGETEGTVKSVGFIATRIQTLRREEVNVPNSVIATSVTRNYSRLAAEGGVWVPTKVTIGYDTPWRQVQAMLLLAAERTDGISRDPPPRVLQTALLDYYVEYGLIVNISEPAQKLFTMDRLHANIQDTFNEYGVQIMSPNYRSDPAAPKIVPKEKWFEPPAAR